MLNLDVMKRYVTRTLRLIVMFRAPLFFIARSQIVLRYWHRVKAKQLRALIAWKVCPLIPQLMRPPKAWLELGKRLILGRVIQVDRVVLR